MPTGAGGLDLAVSWPSRSPIMNSYRPERTPRWPAAAGVTLCAIGFGIAGYLTFEHYTSSTSLTCPAGGGAVNCLKVTTSIYSMIHGVPVALLGLVFFAVMAVLQSPPAWRSHRSDIRGGQGRMVADRGGHRLVAGIRRVVQDRRHLPVVHVRARAHLVGLHHHCVRQRLHFAGLARSRPALTAPGWGPSTRAAGRFAQLDDERPPKLSVRSGLAWARRLSRSDRARATRERIVPGGTRRPGRLRHKTDRASG